MKSSRETAGLHWVIERLPIQGGVYIYYTGGVLYYTEGIYYTLQVGWGVWLYFTREL